MANIIRPMKIPIPIFTNKTIIAIIIIRTIIPTIIDPSVPSIPNMFIPSHMLLNYMALSHLV